MFKRAMDDVWNDDEVPMEEMTPEEIEELRNRNAAVVKDIIQSIQDGGGNVVDIRGMSAEEQLETLNKFPWIVAIELRWIQLIFDRWKREMMSRINLFGSEIHGKFEVRTDLRARIVNLIGYLIRMDPEGSDESYNTVCKSTVSGYSLTDLYGPVDYNERLPSRKLQLMMLSERAAAMRCKTAALVYQFDPLDDRTVGFVTHREPPAGEKVIVDEEYLQKLRGRLVDCLDFLSFHDPYDNAVYFILLVGCIGSKHPAVLVMLLDLFRQYAHNPHSGRNWPEEYFPPEMESMIGFTMRIMKLWPILAPMIPQPWYDDGEAFAHYTILAEKLELEHNRGPCSDILACPFNHGETIPIEDYWIKLSKLPSELSDLRRYAEIICGQHAHLIYNAVLFVPKKYEAMLGRAPSDEPDLENMF